MPPFGPINRRDLVAALRRAGFEGPYSAKKHEIMIRQGRRVRVPNPHRGDVSKPLLASILREADISKQEWESL